MVTACARYTEGSLAEAVAAPLVSSSISHRFQLFPVSLRVKRPSCGNSNQLPPDRSGSVIDSFSSFQPSFTFYVKSLYITLKVALV